MLHQCTSKHFLKVQTPKKKSFLLHVKNWSRPNVHANGLHYSAPFSFVVCLRLFFCFILVHHNLCTASLLTVKSLGFSMLARFIINCVSFFHSIFSLIDIISFLTLFDFFFLFPFMNNFFRSLRLQHVRYNIVFLVLTYAVPMIVMIGCYFVMVFMTN